MVTGDTRRIVVIKNISSNLIEEAILILKCEPPVQKGTETSKSPNVASRINEEFILKEAEAIISSYSRENRLPIINNKRGRKSAGFLKNKVFINILINLALLGSIAFLLFLAVKLI